MSDELRRPRWGPDASPVERGRPGPEHHLTVDTAPWPTPPTRRRPRELFADRGRDHDVQRSCASPPAAERSREMSALPGGLGEPTTGHVPRRPPTGSESMDLELWPRRPRPDTRGPHFECEITQLAELRTMRVRLRTWVPSTFEAVDAGAAVLDEVVLVVDELTTNGLRHGGAPVQVRAIRTSEGLLLDISDGDPQHGPEPAVGRDPALGGMGLHIVAHVTIDRGWSIAGDRKHVWARLPPLEPRRLTGGREQPTPDLGR